MVWQQGQGANAEVFYYQQDGQVTTRLTSNSREDISPYIGGSRVAWTGWDGQDYEVYVYDGTATTQLTDNATNDQVCFMNQYSVGWNTDSGVKYHPFQIIPGDANGDGNVDVSDLGIIAFNYSIAPEKPPTWSDGDFNGDSRVDVSDLGILAANYGSAPVPVEQMQAWESYDSQDWEITLKFLVPSLPGDRNHDGRVNDDDLPPIEILYGATWDDGDFNGDGKVDVTDIGIVASNYGLVWDGRTGLDFSIPYQTSPQMVPEPMSIMLLMAVLGLVRSMRRGM